MEDIRILEKPESISFDEIHELLSKAHSVNKKQGFSMRTANLSGDEIEKRIGKDGKCWVALDGEKLVGTLSLRIINRNTWYAKGKIPDYMLAGVLPEYTGRHINSKLAQKAFEYAARAGYDVMELDTAENNTHAIEVYKHQGFRLVSFRTAKGVDHYSVVMVKWLSEQKFSDLYCKIRFLTAKIKVKALYRTDGSRKF